MVIDIKVKDITDTYEYYFDFKWFIFVKLKNQDYEIKNTLCFNNIVSRFFSVRMFWSKSDH